MALTAKKGKVKTGTGSSGIFEWPSDIIPEDEEAYEKWMHSWSDALFKYGSICLDEVDIENFRHAQGIVDETEYEHLTKLYCPPNSKKVLPVRIPAVNALPRLLNDIIGRVDEHNFSWNVCAVSQDAIVEKLDKLVNRQTEDITRMVRQQSGITEILGRPLVEGDDVEPVDPKEVLNRNLNNFHQEGEINLSKGIKYLMNKRSSNFRYKFIHQGLYNYLITRKMAFDTMIEFGDPNFDPIDTRLLVYELESGSPFIHKGRLSGYYFGITPQQVIDRCPDLKEDEVKAIQEMTKTFRDGELKGPSDFWFRHPVYNSLYLNGMKQYWKALRKKWVKITPNAFDADNPHVNFVSEDEVKKWNKKKRQLEQNGTPDESGVEFVERFYDVWFECTRLSENIRYQCREIPNQLIDGESPSEQDGPIVGVVDEIPSIIDLTKALDRLRIEAFATISRLANQTVGKIMIVDESMDENDQDNLYNMMAFRVYKINSNKDGDMQDPNAASKMMPKEIDLGLSSAVSDLMRWIQFIDQNILLITGLNEPYMGEVKSDQGLGVTQLANQSAQRALQPYMATFYTVVEQTLQRMLDLMGPAWGDTDTTRYWIGDKGAEFFKLSKDIQWNTEKYGFYLENTVSDDKRRQFMVNMASQLLPHAKDPDMALAVINMFSADSSAEANKIFKEGIAAMKKLQAEEMALRKQEVQAQQQANAQVVQQRAAADAEKNKTILTKTQMEQAGETERTKMELFHDENVQSTKQKNDISKIIAGNVLQSSGNQ